MMKKFRQQSKMMSRIGLFCLAALLFSIPAAAQAEAPLDVSVTFLKSTFSLDDPNELISVIITLKNPSDTTAIFTQENFSELEFNLNLYFKGPGPDGGLITAKTYTEESSPTPSIPPVRVKTERLEGGWIISMPLNDVRKYYALTEPGKYLVWFEIPFVQYDPNQIEPIDCNEDGIIDDCVPYNAVIWDLPIKSFDETQGQKPVTITLTETVPQVTSTVRIIGTEFYFDKGSKPPMTRRPLSGVEVRLYKMSDIEIFGITKVNYKAYASICTNSNIPFILAAESPGGTGEYLCHDLAQDEYVIIGYGNEDTAYRHIGGSPVSIDANDPAWGNADIVRDLILMTDMRGRKAPGKIKKIKGSNLTIIEPEYIEWDDNQAFYPFAFVTEEDWEVEISVKPPKGFDIDKKSLKDTVSAESKAIQFTITDEGGEWGPSKVKYKAKHKKTTKDVESEIGVKLTKKLAKEKDLTVWGEEKDKDKDKDK
ncbi:MAG: hypothetical protein MIO92_10610 [Methanosarcinaceae archaeon]|nr:hypothetical protein [Methanosarcinaceae archaeon]